jgi:hypothetical protein
VDTYRGGVSKNKTDKVWGEVDWEKGDFSAKKKNEKRRLAKDEPENGGKRQNIKDFRNNSEQLKLEGQRITQ